MISIITAVYNQRPMNELFWENLQRYTHHPFELIIIDNASTDGSADFFESMGARVIRNAANYAYPHCQNQGIALARHDWLAFLNNDVIVSPGWDRYLLASMQANGLEIATACGIEAVETPGATQRLKRRWQRIRNMLGVLGHGRCVLQAMHRLMYLDWENWCRMRAERWRGEIREGFVGNTVVLRRSALDKIGLWDERIQGADFDLYLRSKLRAREVGDIRPVHVCLDAFVHHYIRLTIKGGYPPFADRAQLISVEEKWGMERYRWLDEREVKTA